MQTNRGKKSAICCFFLGWHLNLFVVLRWYEVSRCWRRCFPTLAPSTGTDWLPSNKGGCLSGASRYRVCRDEDAVLQVFSLLRCRTVQVSNLLWMNGLPRRRKVGCILSQLTVFSKIRYRSRFWTLDKVWVASLWLNLALALALLLYPKLVCAWVYQVYLGWLFGYLEREGEIILAQVHKEQHRRRVQGNAFAHSDSLRIRERKSGSILEAFPLLDSTNLFRILLSTKADQSARARSLRKSKWNHSKKGGDGNKLPLDLSEGIIHREWMDGVECLRLVAYKPESCVCGASRERAQAFQALDREF